MPRRKTALGRNTRKSFSQMDIRLNENQDERSERNENNRQRTAQSREMELSNQRECCLNNDRFRKRSRKNESEEISQLRVASVCTRFIQNRQQEINTFQGIEFQYDRSINYSLHRLVVIGPMNKVCRYCNALKFKNEAPGMCCLNEVKLPELQLPIEPLKSLVSGATDDSKHFLMNIRKYNSCFQMTSFGATRVIHENFMPTFKVQGQIYHLLGSLLPVQEEECKYLQIYFMGDDDKQIDQRCKFYPGSKREIIVLLQSFFHQHNALISLFKTAIEKMPVDNYNTKL